MPPAGDGNLAREVDLGPAVVVMYGHSRIRAQNVELRHGLRRGLYARGLRGKLGAKLHEQLIFQARQPVFGRQDGVFQLLQLFGDVALARGERLLADVAVGHERKLPLGDFDIVAEHAVITHAQVADAGFFLLARFDVQKRLLAAGLDIAQTVDLLVRAGADQPALAQRKGRIVGDGVKNPGRKILQRVKTLVQPFEHRGLHAGKTRFDLRQRLRALRHAHKVAAVGRARGDARHDALEIRDGF